MELITLDEYKEFESLSSTNDDVKITALITSVSQLVKTYCGNSFIDYYDSDYTEEFNLAYPTSGIQLTEAPVRDVTSVQERAGPTEAYTLLGAGEYVIDASSDMLYRVRGTSVSKWCEGPGAVVVSYTAGYPSTPEDLKLAIIDLITYYRKNEHKERRQLSGASIANQGTTSQWRNVDFPDHIKRVLDLYKQIYV